MAAGWRLAHDGGIEKGLNKRALPTVSEVNFEAASMRLGVR